MAGNLMSLAFLWFLATISQLPPLSLAISGCGGPCKDLNDCQGQLICIGSRCNDDPDVGTHICSNSPSPPRSPTPPTSPSSPTPPSSGGGCSQSGTLTCRGVSYPTYTCSPPVTSSTSAQLTLNDFSQGGDGGAQSECDGQWHDNSERVVALSTGWYSGGSRCLKMIRITSVENGRTTTAKVVDECDSMHGCDQEHAFQPPCKNNIVDGSLAVWQALGLDTKRGVVPVTWSMA